MGATSGVGLICLCAALGLADAQFISRGAASARMPSKLPGLDSPVPFKMYSGYLRATEKHFLHYWLVESQSAPAYDPLVLWLNGGPGCSSFSGALEELGPYNLTDEVTLVKNEWSWNKKANVLFLESPAGVGASYTADFVVETDDKTVALHNAAALKDFFFQFPQFSRHDFYVTGESYAGIYVPTLVEQIIDGMPANNINLKGIAIGNGLLNEDINTQTTIEFAYYHGLIDPDEWQMMLDRCCAGCIDGCEFAKSDNDYCTQKAAEITQLVWIGGLNPYDINRECWHSPLLGKTQVSNGYVVRLKWMAPPSVRAALKPTPDAEGDEVIIISDPTCSNESAITDYMNQPKVREAFNIPYHVGYWTTCKAGVKWKYTKQYTDVSPQIRKAIAAGVRVLIYNGDTDMVCNYMMGQRFSERLGLPLIESKRPWKYAGEQIGGFVTRYQGLDFATIKGAGHMAPGWRPQQMYHLINAFLTSTNY